MDQPDQMWAWAHEQPTQAPLKVDASQVLAVLVAHNGEQWLPRTLVAVARLDVQPGRLVAVDAGSTDGSRALLEKGRSDGLIHDIIDGPPDQGFGACVQLAVEQAADFDAQLLWLLHDDSAPTRRCLTELLLGADDAGEEGQRPAIVVPKLLHPKRRNHPDQMSAVGESIAPSGARVPTVERGDIDQHQLEPARVLGASTAGMLITMDAWRELGGFNPEIPLFRDGVELGWRANAHGMVVRTWPQASLRHVEAGSGCANRCSPRLQPGRPGRRHVGRRHPCRQACPHDPAAQRAVGGAGVRLPARQVAAAPASCGPPGRSDRTRTP